MDDKVNVFISQIMKDIDAEVIKDTREKIIEGIIKLLKTNGYEANIIDSYINIDVPETVDRRIYYLGESIKLLAGADLVLIPEPPLSDYPGVQSEANVALVYKLPFYYYKFDKNNEIIFFKYQRG
jgi:hypothetical protein